MASCVSLGNVAIERPPAELVADIGELLGLLGDITDPIAERIQPAAEEQLGLIFAWLIPVELKFRASLKSMIEALPGNAPSKP